MKKTPLQGANSPRFRSELKRGFAASASVLALSLLAQPVTAQTAPETVSNTEDTIVITGTRQIIQDAIALKKQAITVVDGLSADEIGDLPALSIGEALEQITGVGAQREGSGATEVSIRGLGPFLGSTVINGREATNGGGNRSVNFSQFPSELFNKLEVYKSQEASFIEGGVAGQIALSTLKPLEYGKQRIQLQAKGSIQPDNLDINDRARTLGYRLTGSYVDQWEGNKFGEFGLSVGGQIQRRPNAEQESRSSSTFQACRLELLDGNSCNDTETFRSFVEDEFDEDDLAGFSEDGFDALSDQELLDTFLDLPSSEFDGDTFGEAFINNPDIQAATDINPFTGQPFGVTEDFVLTTSSRSLRQNVTDDNRDSIFGAVQWRPNERIDINLDAQYSERTFTEIRSEVSFDANDIEPNGDSDLLDGFELQTTETGALRVAGTSGQIESRTQFSERSEEYIGVGGNISWDLTDRLNVTVDGSYSDTSRVEEQFRGRVSTGSVNTGIEVLQNGSDGVQFTVLNTDVNDPTLFTDDNVEVQEDLNQNRNSTISALRGDVTYDLDGNFFSAFKAGARYSSLEFDQLPRVRDEIELDDGTDFLDGLFPSEIGGVAVVSTIELDVSTGDNGDIDVTATAEEFVRLGFLNDGDTDTPNEGFSNLGALAAAACQADEFIEDNFLDGETNGNLITNIDSDGNEIAAGTGNTFLSFDGLCLPETLLGGRSFASPSADDASVAELVQSVDIEEETIAFYGQLDFNTELDGLPLRGNFGLRYIDTTLTSNSFRGGFEVEVDDEGNVTGLNTDGNTDSLVPLRDRFSYDEFLPSVNAVLETSDNVLVRGGVFRAISRPNPSDLGNGRSISTLNLDETTDTTTIADFIGGVIANGNPNLEPFTSWNYDAAVEWYPNEDSILSVGAYYKVFNGGFQNTLQTETFNVNGEDITVDVPVQTTTDETSNIFGVEVNAAHAFTYLPGALSGLGFKLSYNYADSDFEFEDGQFGEAVTVDQQGEIATVREGFIPPANLVGLSRHTASGQVYWGFGDLTVTGIGKYRSSFFQQSISTPLNLRFIDEAFVLDARLSYKLNKNLKLSLEGTNLLNTPREQFNPTRDSFAEINVFGPRYFAGITAKF